MGNYLSSLRQPDKSEEIADDLASVIASRVGEVAKKEIIKYLNE